LTTLVKDGMVFWEARMSARKAPLVRETVSLYEAKTRLSRLVERAAAGEEIVIAKSGKPKALLVPLGDTRAQRRFGRGKGKWRVARDFDAPLPDDVRDAFEGRRT
jgi:prevent-host-death family protein